jgi:hypothetical protein
VGRQSLVRLIVNVLVNQPKHQLSLRRLAQELDWDEEKFRRVVDKADQDPSIPLERGPGGVIRYRGSERGANVGIYNDVKRILERHWAPWYGLRSPRVEVTANRGERGDGVWSHPDLAMSVLPKRRNSKTDPPALYSIEVEVYTGFDIRSVFQAHAQGLGANQSWVFFAT